MNRWLAPTILIAAAACGGARPIPYVVDDDAEATQIVGGLVTRRVADGWIEVIVTVALHGQTAAGSVEIAASTPEAACGSAYVRLARARAWLALGHALHVNPALAFDAVWQGTEDLGRRGWLKPGAKDDSLLLLSLAQEKHLANPDHSYAVTMGILLRRIRQFAINTHTVAR